MDPSYKETRGNRGRDNSWELGSNVTKKRVYKLCWKKETKVRDAFPEKKTIREWRKFIMLQQKTNFEKCWDFSIFQLNICITIAKLCNAKRQKNVKRILSCCEYSQNLICGRKFRGFLFFVLCWRKCKCNARVRLNDYGAILLKFNVRAPLVFFAVFIFSELFRKLNLNVNPAAFCRRRENFVFPPRNGAR